jgi:replicative DNA helicase
LPDGWAALCRHGLPVEQSVLGACLVYPDAIDVASEMLTADDFAELAHRVLFETMVKARSDGRRFDAALLRAALADRAGVDLGGVSMGQYIGRLVSEAPIAIAVRDHVRSLREIADYRRLYLASETLRERASQGAPAGLPRDIAADVMRELDAVVSAHLPSHLRRVTAGEAAASVMRALREPGAAPTSVGFYGVPELDQMTRGLHRGHLTIVAARPSMGKSAFAVSAGLSVASRGAPALFVSLEMPAEELAQRSLSCLAYDRRLPVPYVAIAAGAIDDGQARRLADAGEVMNRLPLVIEQQPGLTPAQIAARARNLAQQLERQGKKLGLVIVDHLGKVRPSDRYAGNRTTELGEITGALKDMAGELNCAVMALCQLNRQTEQRDNKRPTLGDLRESGRIEEDADNVLLLYREAYYQERSKKDGESAFDRQNRIGEVEHDLEIILAKQRQGPTGVVEAWCDMKCNVIQGKG